MSVAKALPLFHPELRELPAQPTGHRILLRPFPPDEASEGGLSIPTVAQERPYAGTLLAAGDDAAAKLRDRGARLGDEIWWGKFTGVIEEWQHIVKEGTDPACKHDGNWQYLRSPGDRMQLRECVCGAHKLSEPVIVANVDDVMTNVSLQLRKEKGQVIRYRGEDPEGKTVYYWKDLTGEPDGFGECEPASTAKTDKPEWNGERISQ